MSMKRSGELSERNTKANGPRMYQLNRDLALLSQEHDPVTLYYSKMKKIWDELRAVEGPPQCHGEVLNKCTCNLSKRLEELGSRRKLMQFLKGLNSRHEALRNQILAMDPLPSVGRAYCVILQAEKQTKVTDSMTAKHEFEAHALQKEGSEPASAAQKDAAQNSHLDAVEAPTGEQSYNGALVDAVCQQVLKALKRMEIGLPVNNGSSASSSNTFAEYSMASSTPFVVGTTTSSSSASIFSSSSKSTLPTTFGATSSATGFSFGAATGGASSDGNKPSVVFGSSPPPSQPVFGNNASTPTFGFGSTSAPSGNNDQMSMEDSMAEDSMQAPTATPAPVFGQSPIAAPLSGSFLFVAAPSPSPAPAPGFMGAPSGNPFQFGSQPNQMPPQNPSAFQSSGRVEFLAGSPGSFSLGSGGVDKANRRVVIVKSKMRRK